MNIDRELPIYPIPQLKFAHYDLLKLHDNIRCKMAHVRPLAVGRQRVPAMLTTLSHNSFRSYCANTNLIIIY